MRTAHCCRFPGRKRSGTALVVFALLLPVLLGMVGLVIDVGMLLAAHRQVQNAADAAAVAAAVDKLAGRSDAVAGATALQYVQQYNGLADAGVTLNMPPASGPYAGNNRYVEVIVSDAARTWFIQVVGAVRPVIAARAVAGNETVLGEGGMETDVVFLVE